MPGTCPQPHRPARARERRTWHLRSQVPGLWGRMSATHMPAGISATLSCRAPFSVTVAPFLRRAK
jgi:hypothetical protein